MEINLKNNFLIGECIHGFMIWPMGDGVLGPCLKNYGEWSEGENIICLLYTSDAADEL